MIYSIMAGELIWKTGKAVGVKKAPKVRTKEKVKVDIVCDQCGKTFKNKEASLDHIRVKHEKKKIYKCRQCRKSFSYRSGLLDHRKTACKGPIKENRWIFWGKGGKHNKPKCIHPDCGNLSGNYQQIRLKVIKSL